MRDVTLRPPTKMRKERRLWPWYVALFAPFVATLWVPFFDSVEPRVGGVPYFYWYQFLWIGISSALTGIVYFATQREDPDADSPPRPGEGGKPGGSR